jgi:sugar/nucleoside kinase (ribokinase family)
VRALAGQDAGPRERLDVFLTGLVFLDIVFTGLDSPPVPGTEIWAKGLGSGPGGIANFAVALQRLGLTTSLAAAFGADLPGDLCRQVLADAGVDLSRSRRFEDWTTPVTVAVPYPGDRALITYGDPPPLSQDDLVGQPPASRAALVHLAPDSGAWIERARAAGSLVFADVGWDPSQQWVPDELEHLRCCHAFLPNADEAMGYTRTSTPAAALSRLADLVPLAVVTCGADGAIAVDGTTGESASAPGLAVDVVDTTGAGDVFGAGLAAATLAGWPLAERLRFAVLTSALSLRRPGGAMAAPGWEEIAAWWTAVRHTDDTALRRDYAFLDDVIPLRRSDER